MHFCQGWLCYNFFLGQGWSFISAILTEYNYSFRSVRLPERFVTKWDLPRVCVDNVSAGIPWLCRGARCWLRVSPRWVHRTAATISIEITCTLLVYDLEYMIARTNILLVFNLKLTWKKTWLLLPCLNHWKQKKNEICWHASFWKIFFFLLAPSRPLLANDGKIMQNHNHDYDDSSIYPPKPTSILYSVVPGTAATMW